MFRTIFLTFGLILFTVFAFGQKRFSADENYYEQSKGIIYNKEFSMDFKFHTNGYALGVNIGQIKTYFLTRYFNIELGELKHIKEYKQSFDFQYSLTSKISRAFILGKENNFYVLRAGYGEKRYLTEKAPDQGLAIGFSYEAGPSLGLLKPYYLELIRSSELGGQDRYYIQSEKFSEENANLFTDLNFIYGSTGFSKGFNEISVVPGAHAKCAVHFGWGAFDEYVKALEAGIMLDFYFKKIPLMVESPQIENVENKPFFINLYLNLQLGKRW